MRTLTIAVALAMAGLTAMPAAAGGPSVGLDLRGGYAARQMRACGDNPHRYTFYRPGSPIRFTGTVRPAPRRGFRVEVKLRACRAGNDWKTVTARIVRGGSRGRFSGSFPRQRRGLYYLRAQYGRTESSKEQLQVR